MNEVIDIIKHTTKGIKDSTERVDAAVVGLEAGWDDPVFALMEVEELAGNMSLSLDLCRACKKLVEAFESADDSLSMFKPHLPGEEVAS